MFTSCPSIAKVTCHNLKFFFLNIQIIITFIIYENVNAENKIRVVKDLLFNPNSSFSVLLVDIMQASQVFYFIFIEEHGGTGWLITDPLTRLCYDPVSTIST